MIELKKITNWEQMRKLIDGNFKNLDEKYKEFIKHQQNLARTKYLSLSPVSKWKNSFKDTVEYLKFQIK